VISTKLSPEPQKRSSQVELPIRGFLFGTMLLVNVYWWELTRLLTALFLCHIGTTSALLVMIGFFFFFFVKPLKKVNSRELLTIGIIGIILARYSNKTHNIRSGRPLVNFFKGCSLKCPHSPVSNCSSSTAEIPPRRNI